MLDVLAFRLYYRLTMAANDAAWLQDRLQQLRGAYPAVPASTPELVVESPNSRDSEAFIREARPDLVIALCKNILAQRVFTIPPAGTFVFHPGVCPEYRNAHGCFWALAHDDHEHVGMTLLRIDKGIDTGPVLAYFGAAYDEVRESHIVIQHRVVLDNLDQLRDRLLEAAGPGGAKPIDTTGRRSHEWGQPWMTAFRRWKAHARRRQRAAHRA